MISREEARALVLKHARLLSSEDVNLIAAANLVLASDVVSPISHPGFDQSAMDGYCFNHISLAQGFTLKQCGEIQAGGDSKIEVGVGECARIFTGARLPSSCDTVIMQEQTSADGDQITFTNTALKTAANVRLEGEQLNKGEVALAKGSLLNSAGIGFLASLGVTEVSVSKKPSIHIICTGNEFAESKSDLNEGKIYESNGQMLVACLHHLGIEAVYETCTDQLDTLTDLISVREKESNLLLITGGVSVGDYDFTVPALEANGFETIFHKINQKPGKPLLFSKKEEVAAFGLPGNPRAVLICFYEYVHSYILKSMGSLNPTLSALQLPLATNFKKKDDKRTHFLAAVIQKGQALLLNVQGSHMLGSMAAAEGLVVLPPEGKDYHAGELVEYHIIPQ
ncbi:MAG: molybdopterin molybdotransferase MoeA [Flavobacteriales bacterium]|nr:molybdopterin molybdotransferase MoeA [Flavobacteriales bacterium]